MTVVRARAPAYFCQWTPMNEDTTTGRGQEAVLDPQRELPAMETSLLRDAVRRNAPDVHIDPAADDTFRVYCRVEGAIQSVHTLIRGPC